jgi:hypothetical protein
MSADAAARRPNLNAESAARADWAVAARAAPVMEALAKAAPVRDVGSSGSLQPFTVTLVNSHRSADKIDIFLIGE